LDVDVNCTDLRENVGFGPPSSVCFAEGMVSGVDEMGLISSNLYEAEGFLWLKKSVDDKGLVCRSSVGLTSVGIVVGNLLLGPFARAFVMCINGMEDVDSIASLLE
jgi:hypothetical protein